MNKRGQASVEFLMTYGWAMLIIVGIIAVIYSLGILNFESFTPQKCEFFGQIECKDYEVSWLNVNALDSKKGDGRIKLAFTNTFGTDLYIYSVKATDGGDLSCDTGDYASATFQQGTRAWGKGTKFVANDIRCTGSQIQRGNRLRANIEVTYYKAHAWCNNGGTVIDTCKFTTYGTLNAKVK